MNNAEQNAIADIIARLTSDGHPNTIMAEDLIAALAGYMANECNCGHPHSYYCQSLAFQAGVWKARAAGVIHLDDREE